MTTKDFVTKKRSPSKKSPRRQSKATSRSPIKKIVMGIIILFLCGLSYQIYINYNNKANQSNIISDNISAKTNILIQEVIEVASKATAEPKPLPEKPKALWGYIDGLKKEKVPVNGAIESSTGSFLVKCRAFRTNKQAKVLSAQIAFQGLENHIERTVDTHKDITWHQVVMGPYTKRDTAERYQQQLKRNGIESCGIYNG